MMLVLQDDATPELFAGTNPLQHNNVGGALQDDATLEFFTGPDQPPD